MVIAQTFYIIFTYIQYPINDMECNISGKKYIFMTQVTGSNGSPSPDKTFRRAEVNVTTPGFDTRSSVSKTIILLLTQSHCSIRRIQTRN